MRWYKLKYNKCPQCEHGDLEGNEVKLHCTTCRFTIQVERAQEIIADINTRDLEYHEPDRSKWDW